MPTALAVDCASMQTSADSIPVATTPEGGWGETWPAPVLAGCDEPLVDEAPDLRGVWKVVDGPFVGHIERIEQAGRRVVITTTGVIHDMVADGTLERGVNDVDPTGGAVSVAARFNDSRLDLFPNNMRRAVVTRYLDGDEMVWRYGPYRNRLRRLEAPTDGVQTELLKEADDV
ncbi:MAG: hypothetical protein ACPHHT_03340 [Ilumatobacteraceae bacterium]